MSKWIDFVEDEEYTGKTKVFNIIAKEGDIILGKIKWFGRWRQYAFFPNSDTVYEKTCLKDIADFLIEQMNLRKSPVSHPSESEE